MLSVGVTGHRPHRLLVPQRKLAARVRSVLKLLATAVRSSGNSGHVTPGKFAALDVVSPLAEGTDRLVAREALALGQHLTALLPFARKDYEATFSDASTIADFRALLRKAKTRIALGGKAERPELAYVSVGLATLARADVVLTIWDGKRAEGRGGTPEILEIALDWGIPIVWIHATDDRKPALLHRWRDDGSAASLAHAARRAVPFSAAAARSLVGGAR